MCCVIEIFGVVFVLSRYFLDFSVGVGAFVKGLSQISLPFSLALSSAFLYHYYWKYAKFTSPEQVFYENLIHQQFLLKPKIFFCNETSFWNTKIYLWMCEVRLLHVSFVFLHFTSYIDLHTDLTHNTRGDEDSEELLALRFMEISLIIQNNNVFMVLIFHVGDTSVQDLQYFLWLNDQIKFKDFINFDYYRLAIKNNIHSKTVNAWYSVYFNFVNVYSLIWNLPSGRRMTLYILK